MRTFLRSKVRLLVLAFAVVLAIPAVALASDVDTATVDTTSPFGSVTLSPGNSGNIDINATVTGRQGGTATFKVYKDWTLSGGTWTGSNPQTFTVAPRVSGAPAQTFTTPGTVTVASGQGAGTFNLSVPAFDVTNTATPNLAVHNVTSYAVTVTNPPDPCAGVTNPDAPVITADPDAANGNSDWYTSVPPVSATSTTSGATITYATQQPGGTKSAYSSTPPTLGQGTTEVFAKATSATCGRTSESSRVFMVDIIAPDVNPASVVDGVWRNTSLSQAFTSSDGGSGLADSMNDTNFTLTAADESANSSTPTEVSRTVYDVAGNSTTRSVSAKIDLTDPVISGADLAPTAWRNSALSASFTASDALSGLLNPLESSFTLTTSGDSPNATTPVTASKTVSDKAGNTDTRTISAFVDTVDPDLGITDGNAASSSVCASRPVQPTTNPTDALSGVKAGSLSTSWVDNTATSGLGSYTYSASVSDNAGNTDSYGPKTYSVVAGSAMSSLMQPINTGTTTPSSFKLGSTVPVKFTLSCGAGQAITNSVAKLYLSKIDSTSGAVNEPIATNSPDIGNTFRVTDLATGQYQFNLSTKASSQFMGPSGNTVTLGEGTWYVYISLDGGEKMLAAKFDLKK